MQEGGDWPSGLSGLQTGLKVGAMEGPHHT
jgi:hypothetical protein